MKAFGYDYLVDRLGKERAEALEWTRIRACAGS